MRAETVRPGRARRWGLLAAAAVGLSGCAHNDVLVFGTSTTIGLDIQTASSQGAAPSLVLGFRREEAVWMPLLANGRDSELVLCTEHDDDDCEARARARPLSHAMYQSRHTPRGGTERVDAYSVFASLGANFNGDARREGVNAGGGLAQFFATGGAAVSIAENPALVTALKIESPAGAAAQASAVAAAAGGSAAEDIEADRSRIDVLAACVKGTDNGWHWQAIVDGIPASATPAEGERDFLESIEDEAQLRASLQTRDRLRDAAIDSAKRLGHCTG